MFIELEDFKNEPNIAIAIFLARTNFGNHTGILVKNEGIIKLYHLAWHLRLDCDDWEHIFNNTNFILKKWVKFTSLTDNSIVNEYRLPSIVGLFEDIFKNNIGKIPYGLNYQETRFNAEGELKLGDGENGLTCATFVACLIARAGWTLVNLSTWPNNMNNEEWRKTVLAQLEKSNASSEHISNIEKEQLNYRLRPEEIAVASSKPSVELPADFVFCSHEGVKFNSIAIS